ncbi:hypothetical protein RDABS01_007978 [Bienertia sinuspersici]
MREKKEVKKRRILGLKLKRGKSRGGVCTPPPTWKFEPPISTATTRRRRSSRKIESSNIVSNNNSQINNCGSSSSVTARQLGANLWEKNKGFEIHTVVEDPPDTTSDDQPVSGGSFHST